LLQYLEPGQSLKNENLKEEVNSVAVTVQGTSYLFFKNSVADRVGSGPFWSDPEVRDPRLLNLTYF
jgi:hypothetical protein